nr:hypothetical protein [Tanacetum cinerariifolium]
DERVVGVGHAAAGVVDVQHVEQVGDVELEVGLVVETGPAEVHPRVEVDHRITLGDLAVIDAVVDEVEVLVVEVARAGALELGTDGDRVDVDLGT